MTASPKAQFSNRLDIHDRKQFELKLEYQPSPNESTSRYLVEAFLFLPASLNIDAETYPRAAFYADIHNYVRFKTPVMSLDDLLAATASPLVKLERWLTVPSETKEADLVYQAKLLSCIVRGAMRRFVRAVETHVQQCAGSAPVDPGPFEQTVHSTVHSAKRILERFRALNAKSADARPLEERTRASLRLVDEYLSLTIEQFFRKATAEMDRLPRSPLYLELRKEQAEVILAEERYRRDARLRSVLSATGDNEEYMLRMGILKKFCQNILFLAARRQQRHFGTEDVLFAIAAGFAMAFATAVAFWAQARFPQVSFNFFVIVVVGYMMKDRIKEGLRRIFSEYASRRLFDRTTLITDPVTRRRVGTCKEKVDYADAASVASGIIELRRADDFITVARGELAETVIRYQKQVVLEHEKLPRVADGISGVTDIIRINVHRLLRDMDDPEYALEYVTVEDLSVNRVRGAKSYPVDLALRFTIGDGDEKRVTTQLVRLVLNRNGIKRMAALSGSEPRSVARLTPLPHSAG